MQTHLEVIVTYNKGTEYLNRGNIKQATKLFKKVLSLGDWKEPLVNIGNCYRSEGLDKKMAECYLKALRDDVPYLNGKPESPEADTVLHALNNLGLYYYTFGDDDKAIKTYTTAITKQPKFWDCWWNTSTAHLRKASSGNLDLFPSAWEMYRARFLKAAPVIIKNKKEDLVYWTPGKKVDSIVVLTEQGIGDYLMFGRYLSRLREYADEIYLQCDPSLHAVFEAAGYKCVLDASDCNASFAYPVCSLGEFWGGDIPAADWLSEIGGARDFGEGFNVGIVWQGSRTHTNDKYRSVAINRFHGLAKYCNLYGLAPGFEGNKFVRSCDIKNWMDTIECIRGLDLVIGIDTSVMHMVGSLGARGWLLQPYKETDFRWGNGVDKCVWYDTIDIYQNPQSWEHVFSCVERDIKELVYER